MEHKTLIQTISTYVTALKNCDLNSEWYNRYCERLEHIECNVLPRGSGIDNGCAIALDRCNPRGRDCIVFEVPFHCMDPNGYYCGWRDFRIVVVPTFDGISIDVIGRDYNGLKDYLADLFYHTLKENYIEPNCPN